MLCKVDRASMANSLEIRIPFLDHRIIELLSSVNMKIKLKGYRRKCILRNTIGRRLPNKLLSARKKGFALPIGKWFNENDFKRLSHRALPKACFDIISEEALKDVILSYKTGNIQIAGQK